MAGTNDKPQPVEAQPETARHSNVAAFANGHGPILSQADQHIALGARTGGSLTDHLPSNEDLLQQLRVDAKAFEDGIQANAGQRPDQSIQAKEQSILAAEDLVTNYTPEQLKNIGDLANAANDPKALQEIMQRFNDPNQFLKLQDGLRLEMERRGSDIDLTATTYRTRSGLAVPTLEVTNNKTGSSDTYTGQPKPPGPGERPADEIDEGLKLRPKAPG